MGELAHDRVGSGEPVVLLHGLGSRRRAFRPLLEQLSGERELIALDLPGFGESPPDPAGTKLSVADHADRVETFCAEAGLECPHVVGNSLGGAIALELGRRGAATSVTTFSPIGFWGRAGHAWCRAALRGGYWVGQHRPQSPPPAIELLMVRATLFVHAFGRPFRVPAAEILATRDAGLSAPGFLDGTDYGLDYRFREPAQLRGVPLTIAWGRRDVMLPYWTQAPRARRLLPRARHVTLPGCGHVPFYDDPDLCSRVVLEGSAGVARPGA